MALKLKYTDEHGILHIDMSPTSSPTIEADSSHPELKSPAFDSINNRFGQYDLFGAKYESGGNGGANEARSLFRSRYNSIEEELANTPYAFTNRNNSILDITIKSQDSPSKDIEDDRFFNKLDSKEDNLFGAQCGRDDDKEEPSFSVTQLIHAQDRYFDLSTKQSSLTVLSDTPVRVLENNRVKKLTNKFDSAAKSAPGSAKSRVSDISVKDAFRVLSAEKAAREIHIDLATNVQAISTPKKKKESSFAILTETTVSSRPSSPRSLPIEPRIERVSPFKGRGFKEASRHNTPKTSTTNSRASSPLRRRTNSLSKIDMAATAVPPLPIHTLSRPHSPINFVKQNIEEVRELSELNREKHEAEAEEKRRIEEEALLKEMGLIDTTVKTDAIRSVVGSRNTSRSNSPSKINLRSRSNSPSAILHFENITANSKDFINPSDGAPKQVMHKSRMRSVSKSQPQSNNGSPKHSKIPKRQNSVSPPRAVRREVTKKIENNLNNNQRFISISTSSINDTTRIETVSEKKGMSKSSQHLSISPSNIRGKPPISPGRGGPPPSNKTINPKRLSPIVGTPSRSPVESSKPASARTPKASPAIKKTNKTAGNTPSTSRVTSRQPSRAVSPDKKTTSKPTPGVRPAVNRTTSKPITRTPSTKSIHKPPISNKPEVKKPISRTNSVKNLTRTPSTKTLNERPPTLKRKESRKDVLEKAKSNTKINEVGSAKGKKDAKNGKDDKTTSKTQGSAKKKPETVVETEKPTNNSEEIETQDNETQYDSITNEKGDLVTLTKKNVVSMTTAAITAQPLEVVTTVTNQLPAAFEKAREKGIFERHSSKDSLAPKDEENNNLDEKKNKKEKVFNEDNVKLKLLQPPYNNPQVERAKQKIDDILKAPEVSTESILNTATVESTEVKNTLKSIANKTRNEIKEKREDTAKKFNEIKEEIVNQADKGKKEAEKFTEEVRTEATKIVESIITPVEEPKEVIVPEKEMKDAKKDIEPIVMVVNEKVKPKVVENSEIVEKVNESLVKGDPEVEVQSSNMSTPIIKVENKKQKADGNGSDHSTHSNGGFPQSTSTTPKPPARTKKEAQQSTPKAVVPTEDEKKRNICQRLLGKCAQKTKCCSCCVKPEVDEDEKTNIPKEQKTGMAKWSLCKKTQPDDKMKEAEKAVNAGKLSTIEFENEKKHKRGFRDVFCGCCRKSHRVGDSAATRPGEQGCFGRRPDPEVVERRDSILSDRPPKTCCSRLFNWFRGPCRRRPAVPERRPSMFSKNKSLSPTLPPEDTRPKLDPSLIEHTSVMRGAIPVLPIPLAYFCLMCNVLVPGLGTILSGLFCLCFGVPRFGSHDGAKHRIGSFVINLLVGCGQLFTVLFCLVGWGWSIWWGVIMVRVSRKYRKLAAEARMEEEQAPPVTANNHNSRA